MALGTLSDRGADFPDRGGPGGRRIRFTSTVLPPFLRRRKNIEELLPASPSEIG